MRKKPTRKRPYFTMESAMTAILRDASGKMHHGILFDPPLEVKLSFVRSVKMIDSSEKRNRRLAFEL